MLLKRPVRPTTTTQPANNSLGITGQVDQIPLEHHRRPPMRGRFFVVSLAFCLLLLLLVGYWLFGGLVEVKARGKGWTGIISAGKLLVAYDLASGTGEIIEGDRVASELQFDGFPIGGAYLQKQKAILIFQYLSPCFYAIDDAEDMKEYCTRPDYWIPAAVCSTSSGTFLAAFGNRAISQEKKTFPYYMPGQSTYPMVVTPFSLRNETIRISQDAEKSYGVPWHEESAGTWRLVCVNDGRFLVMNPNAEEVTMWGATGNRLIWRAETGRKPTDIAVDVQAGAVYVACPQESNMEVFALESGQPIGEINTGNGATSLITGQNGLLVLNPYKRTLERYAKNGEKIASYWFEDGLPTAMTEHEGRIVVVDGSRKAYWEVSPELKDAPRLIDVKASRK